MKQDFVNLAHPSFGQPKMRYIYRNEAGEAVLIANRYEPSGRKKIFLPYDVAQEEWKAPKQRLIYNLDRVANANSDEPVIMVEGEKCADALTGLGYLSTTTFGGSNALGKADLSPLNSRNVILWPDFDDPGLSYVRQAADALCNVTLGPPKIIPISEELLCKVMLGNSAPENPDTPMYPKGWDVADAITEGWGKAEIDRLLSFAVPQKAANTNAKPSDVQSNPVTGRDIEVWKTPEGEPFASLRLNGHLEHWPLGSSAFKRFLSFQHYQAEGKMLSQSALDDQRRTLEGQALFGDEEHRVFHRIGKLGRTLYLDLGGADWKAVAITSEGWQLIDQPPARFRRSGGMLPLPTPEVGAADINLLRPFLNTASEQDFQMLVAWLIGCFHPRGPYCRFQKYRTAISLIRGQPFQ